MAQRLLRYLGGRQLMARQIKEGCLFRKLLRSVVLSPDRFPLGGIPAAMESLTQVGRATLWALVCTADALNMYSIADPYEIYKYMHPSEVRTCLGSGMGGTESLAKMVKEGGTEQCSPRDVIPNTHLFLALYLRSLWFYQHHCCASPSTTPTPPSSTPTPETTFSTGGSTSTVPVGGDPIF